MGADDRQRPGPRHARTLAEDGRARMGRRQRRSERVRDPAGRGPATRTAVRPGPRAEDHEEPAAPRFPPGRSRCRSRPPMSACSAPGGWTLDKVTRVGWSWRTPKETNSAYSAPGAPDRTNRTRRGGGTLTATAHPHRIATDALQDSDRWTCTWSMGRMSCFANTPRASPRARMRRVRRSVPSEGCCCPWSE